MQLRTPLFYYYCFNAAFVGVQQFSCGDHYKVSHFPSSAPARFVPSLPQAEIFNYALRFSREKIMRRALSRRSLLRRFACVSASALITAPSCRRARRPPAQQWPLLSGTRARKTQSETPPRESADGAMRPQRRLPIRL
jgi:hypothetical protein